MSKSLPTRCVQVGCAALRVSSRARWWISLFLGSGSSGLCFLLVHPVIDQGEVTVMEWSSESTALPPSMPKCSHRDVLVQEPRSPFHIGVGLSAHSLPFFPGSPGSNPGPLTCEARALPSSLPAHTVCFLSSVFSQDLSALFKTTMFVFLYYKK